MQFVVLGLGSNVPWQGNSSIQLLAKAVGALGEVLSDLKCSSVYRTRPLYVEDQDDFLNMAVCGFVDDALSPHALLERIHLIEASLGRDRSREIRNGPRPIDIDIELFADRRVLTADLEIPHPRIGERAFVLVPMLEILPESADNVESAPFARMLDALGGDGVEKFLDAAEFVSQV